MNNLINDKRIEELEKRVAALEVQAQEQPKIESTQNILEELANGKITINEARFKFNLLPLKDELANSKITKQSEVKQVELKIKVKISTPSEIKEIIELVRETEKEYSCNCTLLEIEIN